MRGKLGGILEASGKLLEASGFQEARRRKDAPNHKMEPHLSYNAKV
jgi:hypothetical protein